MIDKAANQAFAALFQTFSKRLDTSHSEGAGAATAFQSQLNEALALLDRAAEAELANDETELALSMVRLGRAMKPDSAWHLRRVVSVALRAGEDGVVDDILANEELLVSYNDAAWAVEILGLFGGSDRVVPLAQRLVDRRGLPRSLLSMAVARRWAAAGHMIRATIAVQQGLNETPNDPSLLRLLSDLKERLGDVEGAIASSRHAAVLHGHQAHLQTSVRLMLSLFDFGAIETLLKEYSRDYPNQSQFVDQLRVEVYSRRIEADRALQVGGAIDGTRKPEIMTFLTDPTAPPDLILWGKMALVAFLRTGPISLQDFQDFSSRLANWEGQFVRLFIGHLAEANLSNDLEFLTERLRSVAGAGRFGDAAVLAKRLADLHFGEEAFFVCVMLLRVQDTGIVPAFMTTEETEGLRDALRQRLHAIDPAVITVLHNQLLAAKIEPGSWPDWETDDTQKALGYRTLFAFSSGRLERRAVQFYVAPTRAPNPIVVITGQLRGFETAWPSMVQYLVAPTCAPVVMSTWDRTTNARGRHAARLDRVLPRQVLEQLRPEERFTDLFEAQFPQTAAMLFGETSVDVDTVADLMRPSTATYLEIETESDRRLHANLPANLNRNMLNMYYKLHRGEQMVAKAECQTGQSFSHIIWIRPDCQIKSFPRMLLRDCLNHDDVAFSTWSNLGVFGDYLMIMPRQAFTVIGSIFQRISSSGKSVMYPWRAARIDNPGQVITLSGLSGPPSLFDALLTSGCLPLGKMPRARTNLVGRIGDPAKIIASFEAELRATERDVSVK